MNTHRKWPALLSMGAILLLTALASQADVLFSDNFERMQYPDYPLGNGWIEHEFSTLDVRTYQIDGGKVVMLLKNRHPIPPHAAASRMLSTFGYSGITVSFIYRGSYVSANNYTGADALSFAFTTDGGTNWSTVATYPLSSYAFATVSLPLPVSAGNQAGFGIRFYTTIAAAQQAEYRGAQVDNVSVTGNFGTSGDSTPPAVSAVMADDVVYDSNVVVTAMVNDGSSKIKSAEYRLDAGSWILMSAADGAFDEFSESVTATISAPVVGNYRVCVKATDVADNISDGTACDTFDVTPAQLSIAFAGQELDLDGAPTQLKAEVTGPCSSGAEVEFFADVGSGYASVGTADTDTSGVATVNAVLPVGVHDIKVKVDDQDMGGDSAPECKGDTDIGITVVADPKASSTGGGWYKVDATPPRVNFGYTAQRKYNKKLDEYSTSGNLLWMHQDSYRLKGVIDSGGMLPEEMCDPEFAACAAFAGEGTLYEHNPAYDPACLPTEYCGLEWINPSPNTPFVIFVNDGGTSRECVSKKKCKDVEKPDQFGIEIELESIPAESDPVYLNGGNLVVR
jgi:hypothetical protein